MPASVSEEEVVRPFHPMPAGYTFVPKGNIYITKNCRKLTHEANKPVFTVQSIHKNVLGIRVPATIAHQVRSSNRATAATRADAVRRKDEALRDKTEAEILARFPKIPREDVVPSILKHTLQKRSGRVGRSREVPLAQVVDLAVRAYIRHRITEYDALLKKGLERDVARRKIQGVVDGMVSEWGGVVREGQVRESSGKGRAATETKDRAQRPDCLRLKKNLKSRVQKKTKKKDSARSKLKSSKSTSKMLRSKPHQATHSQSTATIPTSTFAGNKLIPNQLLPVRSRRPMNLSLTSTPASTQYQLHQATASVPQPRTTIVILDSDDEEEQNTKLREEVVEGILDIDEIDFEAEEEEEESTMDLETELDEDESEYCFQEDESDWDE